MTGLTGFDRLLPAPDDRGCLLLTRLREESQATAAKLRARGWSVCSAPLLSLRALPTPDLARRLSEKPALLITSKSALRMLCSMPCRTLSPNERSAMQTLPLYAVGEESAAFAKGMGFSRVRAGQGTLESLSDEVLRHHPKARALLHLCGKHRRGKLVESLQKAGYYAEKSVLYEAVAAQKLPREACNLLQPSMPSSLYASLFYSPRTAEIFATLYARTFGERSMSEARLRFFCLSHPIGVRLRQSFPLARITSALAPSEACLLDKLEESLS